MSSTSTLVLVIGVCGVALCDHARSIARAQSTSSDAVWEPRNIVAGPPRRWGAGIAFDAAAGNSVLFGGINDAGRLGDTWLRRNQIWTQAATSDAPTARLGTAMT